MEHVKLDDKPESREIIANFLERKIFEEPRIAQRSFVYKFPEVSYRLRHMFSVVNNLFERRVNFGKRKKRNKTLEFIEDIAGLIDFDSKSRPTIHQISNKMTVTINFAVQFEAIRAMNEISLKSFIDSISCAYDWADNSGGKTRAKFFKSYDQKYVFKELKKAEFDSLTKVGPAYFRYLWEAFKKGRESVLVKIYGMFEVQIKEKTTYLIAMENLFFGMDSNCKVFDLKGSELNRFTSSKGNSKTQLDTDFKLEQNGEPIPIKGENFEKMEKAFKNDSDFLALQNLVDYSLLLLVDEHNFVVRMGIIDYLRDWDFMSKMEEFTKTLLKRATPTIIPPDLYKDRFQKAMKTYFMPVYNEH